jgi:DEAD/DEAH box helicase domain-containing protein
MRTRNRNKASKGTLQHALSETLKQALLTSRKISSLYTHQADAIDAIYEGKHVIVSTSTASGKSVIYQARTCNFKRKECIC